MKIQVRSFGEKRVYDVSPNLGTIKLLNDVCAEYNVDPIKFTFTHQRKRVDVSLPIRLQNFSNNALLELVASKKKEKISVVVSNIDGKRYSMSVSPSETFRVALTSLELQHGIDILRGEGMRRKKQQKKKSKKKEAEWYTVERVVVFMSSIFSDLDISFQEAGLVDGRYLIKIIEREVEDKGELASSNPGGVRLKDQKQSVVEDKPKCISTTSLFKDRFIDQDQEGSRLKKVTENEKMEDTLTEDDTKAISNEVELEAAPSAMTINPSTKPLQIDVETNIVLYKPIPSDLAVILPEYDDDFFELSPRDLERLKLSSKDKSKQKDKMMTKTMIEKMRKDAGGFHSFSKVGNVTTGR